MSENISVKIGSIFSEQRHIHIRPCHRVQNCNRRSQKYISRILCNGANSVWWISSSKKLTISILLAFKSKADQSIAPMVICIWKVFSVEEFLFPNQVELRQLIIQWKHCLHWLSKNNNPQGKGSSRGWGVPSRTPWLHHCHCFGWRRLQGMGTCV